MLSRHRLVWIGTDGWEEVLGGPWDAQALACLRLWAENDWPLVVTRQRAAERLALGLPAPLVFDRRRIAVEVDGKRVTRDGEFPRGASIVPMASVVGNARWLELCDALDGVGCGARVYGGHGWQALTGLAYLHDASDLDLLLPVAGASMADAACALLAAAPTGPPRLDGELLFPDGAGVAWREWVQWRAGRASQLLVKRLTGAALERGPMRSEMSA